MKKDQHLSQISTAWTVLFQAHDGSGEEVKAARRQLLQQYGSAVYRYLMAAVRNPDAADELYQEFALKLVRGDFHRAHPDRGRFRDFVKTALYHLVVDHQRRRRRTPQELQPDDSAFAADDSRPAACDEEFLGQWRAELLARAWEGLARWEQHSGQPLHTVLRFRADHLQMQSPEMAARLAAQLGKEVTPTWVRKRLQQAREKFRELLLGEVRQTLDTADEGDLELELLELGLLDYCRPTLERRSPLPKGG